VKVKDECCDARDMLRIGELSARTGVSPRSLRYYGEQGLLEPARSTSGYRLYPASAVRIVGNIKTLLEAGLNTETVRELLPCMVNSERFITCSALLAALDRQLAAAEERLATQQHARELLAGLRRRAAQAS
jgi:DNA-binding transcriptional MerR regulator